MGKPVQPMTLKPALGRAGAIELMGSQNRCGKLGNGAMRSGGNLAAVFVQASVVDELQDAQLVSAGQV